MSLTGVPPALITASEPPVEEALFGLRSRAAKGKTPKAPPVPAALLPVARVAVAVPLPHLDRVFDYLVTEEQSTTATVGARVRVTFHGKRVEGFILDRVASSDHEKKLLPLAAVVSAEPVLSPAIAELARQVADRCAGTLADVLRLAVPPRHARVEAQPTEAPQPAAGVARTELWARYPGGAAFLAALASGGAPRATWTALPGPTWPDELAAAAAATAGSGRGALIVVPDARDLTRVDAALSAALGDGQHVALAADLGPAERYRRWLRVSRGDVRVVVGTRAAMFAPVRDLGLVVCWDDGDELHIEPRAPYPHAREVLTLRAHQSKAAALIGGLAPSVEAVALVEAGWSRQLRGSRDEVRKVAPAVRAAGSDADLARDGAARSARLPHLAFTVVREALRQGPVLVQVPRRGYHLALTCARCRTPARCVTCEGPLARAGSNADLACGWCGSPAADWACRNCHASTLRAAVVGARRTAEELGRAFPGVIVRTSGRDDVLLRVPDEPALVVATPGAEPVCEGAGYAAALLLDGWALLGRAEFRAAEDALRRWVGAGALLRPGAPAVILADPGVPAVQALLRWDPTGHSEREAAERGALRFPPAVKIAAIDGTRQAVAGLLADLRESGLPAAADVLGPVAWRLPDGTTGERALVRVAREQSAGLATALRTAQRSRSARRAEVARVEFDPRDLI